MKPPSRYEGRLLLFCILLMKTDLIRSSKKAACPVCARTKDGDCAWSPDEGMVLCHSFAESPSDANGYFFKEHRDGVHGRDSLAMYTKTKSTARNNPRPQNRFKAPKQREKDINSATVQIEVKVGDLALMVAEGYESNASAGVILAAWCKEYGHDKYAANRLLLEKLQDRKKARADYSVNEDHKLVKDDRLLREAFSDRLRYNELLLQPELDGELFPPAEARVALITEHDLPIKSGDKDVATLIYRLARESPYHPIRQYLEDVYAEYGDDTSILDGFAKRYFGTDDPIHEAMTRRFFIAAAARPMEPGCKHDCAFILKGDQAARKSTFFKVLASKPWFDDSYGSTNSDKDERLKLHYSWIVEWGELEVVFDKKSVSHIKAFLSCETDKIRPPYGASQETLHRPSVIVGSTNEDSFLADPTGNRRYWVVPMLKRIDINQLRKERDRIWAAAVALYKSGEQWWLTDEEEVLAKDDRQKYEEIHPWTYSIEDYVYGLEKVSTKEILTNALDIPISKHNNPAQKRVADIFKKLGWEQTKNAVSHNGRRSRIWKKIKK